MDKPSLVLPMSPMRAAGKVPVFEIKELSKLEKQSLPPISKALPSLKKMSKELPKLEKQSLPSAPISSKPLPSLKKMSKELPKLEKQSLPSAPISSKPFPRKEALPMSPLAKDIRENREEIIQEITEEIEKKTLPSISKVELPMSPRSKVELPMSPRSKVELPMSPRSKVELPMSPRSKVELPMSPRSTLEISQEGVKTALKIESSAGFQPVLTLPFPSDIIIPVSLSTISSKANLPSKPSPERTSKIRIPKISSSVVKPSPKKSGIPKYTEGIALPTTSTVIPMIPITSPSVKVLKQVSVATTASAEVLENIKRIDIKKLKVERVVKKGKDSGYNVNELKAIAGSLNLTKSGNKKDLIQRIKNAILKVNPNAFD